MQAIFFGCTPNAVGPTAQLFPTCYACVTVAGASCETRTSRRPSWKPGSAEIFRAPRSTTLGDEVDLPWSSYEASRFALETPLEICLFWACKADPFFFRTIKSEENMPDGRDSDCHLSTHTMKSSTVFCFSACQVT